MSFLDEIMKVKWIKFSDELPPEDDSIWVSDGKNVWPAESGVMADQEPNYYLAIRENPKPPEKEKHECVRSIGELKLTAWENCEGDLNLRIFREERFSYTQEIVACPFCAYTIEKKIHD